MIENSNCNLAVGGARTSRVVGTILLPGTLKLDRMNEMFGKPLAAL